MKNSNYLLWIAIIMGIGIFISILPIAQQVPYWDQEAYYVDVPYQSPVYKTIEHNKPLYDTVNHRDPVYETLQTIELRDESIWGDDVYKRSNVYNIKKVYSGSDAWGNSEYTFTLYYYTSIPSGSKTYNTYYQIDDWSMNSYEAIVGYSEWNEEVITGYDHWTEEAVDYYETKHRSEVRYRNIIKYKPMTKTVYEWIDIWINDKDV